MKALIIYDSYFGNTEKIAQAIGEALNASMEVEVCKVDNFKHVQLEDLDLLVVGSPTRAFSPSPAIKRFLSNISSNSLQGTKAAAFDTRIAIEDIKVRFLRIMVKVFGYAAEPISKKLKKKGAEIIIIPEGFCVKDTEGPLNEGEIERATVWVKQIIEKI